MFNDPTSFDAGLNPARDDRDQPFSFSLRPTTPDRPAHEHNETLTRNLRAIAKRSPRAAQRIADTPPHADIAFADTPDGAGSATLAGVALASRRRPLDEAQRLAETADLTDAALVVVNGFALGHHVKALNDRAKRAAVLLVFEPDIALLRAVLERQDLAQLFDTNDVLLATQPDDPGELSTLLNPVEGMVAMGVTVLDHPPSRDRLATHQGAFNANLTAAVEAVRTSVVTTLLQTETTLRNLLMNADHYTLRPGVAPIKDTANGTPAVVVSAGPSLARNIRLLDNFGVGSPNEDKLTVIATQTTLRTLLDRGITPHYVTALDYHEISARFYEGLDPAALRRTTLVAEPKVNPAVIDAYPGPVRITNDASLDIALGTELAAARESAGDDGAIPPGATVAHLAYELARHIGANPVILVGQDLAFTDHQYYADRAAIHDTWAPELSDANSVETMEWQRIARARGTLKPATDQLGRGVYTDDQMLTYLDQFERLFNRDKQLGLETIDSTEGGVRKAGSVTLPLARALERVMHRLPHDARITPVETPTDAGDERAIGALRARLSALSNDAATIEKTSKKTQKLLEKLSKIDAHDPASRRMIEDIHRLRDRVHALPDAFGLVQRINQTGALRRHRADRAMYMNAGLSPEDRQRRQIGRDAENVRWTGEAAGVVVGLTDAARAALDGAPKLTRDTNPGGAPGGASGGARSRRDRVKAHAFVRAVPGDADRVFLGEPVLKRTLERVARLGGAGGVSAAFVLVDTPDERERRRVANLIDGWGVRASFAERGLRLVVADDVRTAREREIAGSYRRRTDRARAVAPDAWRSGHLPTVYDEAVEPEWMVRVMDGAGADGARADAALVVGGSWCLFDPELARELVSRHAEHPLGHPLCFTGAAPGLSACVIGRKLMEDLVAGRSQGSAWATVASVLGYVPTKPRRDPLATTACVGVAPAARDAGARCVVDGLADVGVLEGALGSLDVDALDAAGVGGAVRGFGGVFGAARVREIVFEVGGSACDDSARGGWYRGVVGGGAAPALREDVVRRVVGAAGAGVRVVFAGVGGVDGTGDALAHDGLAGLIGAARACGAGFVGVRTDGVFDGAGGGVVSGDDPRVALLAGCDGVELDVVAQTPSVYESLTGRGDLDVVKANAEVVWTRLRGEAGVFGNGGLAERSLIARLVKCDAVYGEMEGFYDAWVVTVGGAVIDPLPASVADERAAALTEPALAVRRRALSRVFVRSDGSVWVGEPWSGAFGGARGEVVGNAAEEDFGVLWRRVVERRSALLGAGAGVSAARVVVGSPREGVAA